MTIRVYLVVYGKFPGVELFTMEYANVAATMAANAKRSHLLIFVVVISAYLHAAKVEGAKGEKSGMRMS